MSIIFKGVFLFLFSYFVISKCKRPFAGPFDIVFRSAFHCDDLKDPAFIYPTKFSKINRTHLVYNNNITLLRDVTDEMQLKVDFHVFGNGGWKKNFLHVNIIKFCTDSSKIFPGVLESVLKSAGVTQINCPIPAGPYEIKNWIFSVNFNSNVFPYGRYKVLFRIYDKEEKILTCGGVEVDIIPKDVRNERN